MTPGYSGQHVNWCLLRRCSLNKVRLIRARSVRFKQTRSKVYSAGFLLVLKSTTGGKVPSPMYQQCCRCCWTELALLSSDQLPDVTHAVRHFALWLWELFQDNGGDVSPKFHMHWRPSTQGFWSLPLSERKRQTGCWSCAIRLFEVQVAPFRPLF